MSVRFQRPIGRMGRIIVSVESCALVLWALLLAACGTYATVTPSVDGPDVIEKIMARPQSYTAYASAAMNGVRRGEYYALLLDFRGDRPILRPDQMESVPKYAWLKIEPAAVAKVYRDIVDLGRQNETIEPTLYRILDERGTQVGYVFTAASGSRVAVTKVGPTVYSVRPVSYRDVTPHKRHYPR